MLDNKEEIFNLVFEDEYVADEVIGKRWKIARKITENANKKKKHLIQWNDALSKMNTSAKTWIPNDLIRKLESIYTSCQWITLAVNYVLCELIIHFCNAEIR